MSVPRIESRPTEKQNVILETAEMSKHCFKLLMTWNSSKARVLPLHLLRILPLSSGDSCGTQADST